MIALAILFRAFNLYTHHAHNMCKGDTFFQDHEFFNELYSFADESYDLVIERYFGTTDESVDLNEIISQSASLVSKMSDNYLKNSLILSQESAKMIDEISKDATLSSGTINMLQGISDKLEVFTYKIKRRLM